MSMRRMGRRTARIRQGWGIWALAAFVYAVAPTTADADEAARYLLLDKPTLRVKAGDDAAGVETDWVAGVELNVLETCRASSETWLNVRRNDATGWLPDAFVSAPSVASGDAARVDRDHALSPAYAPDDLVEVGPGWSRSVTYRLRREAAGALEALVAAARRDGIRLHVVSAYRSWSTQQRLYQRKVTRAGRHQRSVARPGHSEHQLGLAVDLTDGDLEHLLEASFGQTRAGRWLRRHAPRYGFALSYTCHNAPETGYVTEPWHYRYWGLADAPRRHRRALGEAAASP